MVAGTNRRKEGKKEGKFISCNVAYLPGKIKLFYFFLPAAAFFSAPAAQAQQPTVTNRVRDYQKAVKNDSLQKMVELKSIIPGVVYDLRYATVQNFTGTKLYPKGNRTFLRRPAATALRNAAVELADSGYTLKIWDAYRPYSVTRKMWDLIGDERYVANPAKGSGHNRGLAVDLTLVKNGNDADMGTGYDNFTDSAHHAFLKFSETVLRNRALLRRVMERHGFKALETEWWHYGFPSDGRYGVLDLPFRKLAH